MDNSAPRIDCTGATPPVGYHRFHPDVSVNFQCNRWVQWIGPSAIPEVAELAARCGSYPEWIDGLLGLADAARRADRLLAAAYYDRAAEFFMRADDPRRGDVRNRFVRAMRALYDVAPDYVPYHGGALPAYDLCPRQQTGSTIVVFGGFDSYVEEFLPMLAAIVDSGHRVIAFDGPGQGGALEEHSLPMTAEWERPTAAVLDHYNLNDVAAVGISLGGGLVIRAAAFVQRISRAVSMDILDDEFEATARQIGRGVDGCAARPACRAGAWVGQRAGAAGRSAQAHRRMGLRAGHAHHWNGDGLRLPTVDHQDQHPPDLASRHRRCSAARRSR